MYPPKRQHVRLVLEDGELLPVSVLLLLSSGRRVPSPEELYEGQGNELWWSCLAWYQAVADTLVGNMIAVLSQRGLLVQPH